MEVGKRQVQVQSNQSNAHHMDGQVLRGVLLKIVEVGTNIRKRQKVIKGSVGRSVPLEGEDLGKPDHRVGWVKHGCLELVAIAHQKRVSEKHNTQQRENNRKKHSLQGVVHNPVRFENHRHQNKSKLGLSMQQQAGCQIG